jgi:hypothetical protein
VVIPPPRSNTARENRAGWVPGLAGVLADVVEITLDHVDQRRLDRDPAVRCGMAIVAFPSPRGGR